MALLSEQKLSNKIRIQMIEEIAEIDLPGFLFLEIDAALSILNYFKLSNLQKNDDIFYSYLDEISREYNNMMLWLTAQHTAGTKGKISETAWFLTDFLIMKWTKIKLPQQKLVWIESVYRVRVLLKMKEFINRRIYNEKRATDMKKWFKQKVKKTKTKK